jgi:aspartate--ammonia ligase
MKLIIPEGYKPFLNVYDTQNCIGKIHTIFEKNLSAALNLHRVSAPLFLEASTGLNDDLNGYERKVDFDIKEDGRRCQVVQSLAKWKRFALKNYDFYPGNGLYTNMNAIRRDEELDNLHSVYVDQWDWERVITGELRNLDYLKSTVYDIVLAIKKTEIQICTAFDGIDPIVSEDVFFITSEELRQRFPRLTPKQREAAVCREHRTVFIMKIGAPLADGMPHDGRAPDYDDWELNGDLIVYYPVLDCPVELSSMGIRVNERSLMAQLELSGHTERMDLPYHRALLSGELPLTVGGGIGQSRLCMLLLGCAHIGEVQSSLWDDATKTACAANGIHLL